MTILYTLENSDTVYMNGTGVYHIKRRDRPGIVSTLTLSFNDAYNLAQAFQAQADVVEATEEGLAVNGVPIWEVEEYLATEAHDRLCACVADDKECKWYPNWKQTLIPSGIDVTFEAIAKLSKEQNETR